MIVYHHVIVINPKPRYYADGIKVGFVWFRAIYVASIHVSHIINVITITMILK